MKYSIKCLIILGLVSVSSLSAYDTYYGNRNSNSGYKGNSGQKYQYDMSNGNDRIEYSTDIDHNKEI